MGGIEAIALQRWRMTFQAVSLVQLALSLQFWATIPRKTAGPHLYPKVGLLRV